MHILFLTDNFPPEVNAPATRTFEHCREWIKAGHKVTVITGAPNFPQGKVFEGYKNQLWRKEVIENIRVIRVWTYIAANERFFKRTLDYLSYMIMGFFTSLFVRRVDIIVGTSPQFFTICAAYAVSIFKGVPWALELRDIWPESIRVVLGIKYSKTLDLVEKLELFLYKKADVIISLTYTFRKSLISRGVDGRKIYIITNGVDNNHFFPKKKNIFLVKKLKLQDKFVVGYIGTHGLAHALDTVLSAAQAIKFKPNGNRFYFIMLGDGASKKALKLQAFAKGLNNIIFLDSVPKNQVVEYWSLLDASIIHLKNDKLFTSVIPSKIFESMAMSIPILHGVRGESADIIKCEKVGLLFEPENVNGLVENLQLLADNKKLYQRLKANGPIAAKRYDRSILAKNMLNILESQVRKRQ